MRAGLPSSDATLWTSAIAGAKVRALRARTGRALRCAARRPAAVSHAGA